jgi:hypothetical protein
VCKGTASDRQQQTIRVARQQAVGGPNLQVEKVLINDSTRHTHTYEANGRKSRTQATLQLDIAAHVREYALP